MPQVMPRKRGGRTAYQELVVLNPSKVDGRRVPRRIITNQKEFECKTCEVVKPIEEFSLRRNPKDREYFRRLHCKPCFRDKNKVWRDSKRQVVNGILRSHITLKQKYNMSLDEYIDMHERQEGLCKICGKAPQSRLLVVDHDHATKKVRGLLCHKCNNGLGSVNDSIQLLNKMIAYLEKYNAS